jgi:U32 family peptidase
MLEHKPNILAPAGDKNSFLAAIAAGADAIYCGLKIFSARMEADNFGIEELARLTKLAKSKNIDVYIAFNSIIKEPELEKVHNILSKLCKFVDFDALIIQDIAMIDLARKAGFKKEFHLSTLGNCTFPSGLKTSRQLGFTKVVLPREFTIDEIKDMAQKTPDNIELEVFIHGALCYSISGRCYWSSWFGGKSSLRGRCVQPCRRIYEQKGQKSQHFSCMDFSSDVLVKILKQIKKVTTWKIEGRKKGPHYVYYTVKAYKLLRDNPKEKKQALAYLNYAMGRQLTHYNLLSQRKMNPLDHISETGSGLFAGRIKNPSSPYFITREELFVSDLLRIGFEEDQFHDIQRVTRAIPKKGKFYLKRQSKYKIKKNTPVYIIDRRVPELASAIKNLDMELAQIKKITIQPKKDKLVASGSAKPVKSKNKSQDITISRGKPKQSAGISLTGTWISSRGYSLRPIIKNWLWVDPVLFPDEEKICSQYISAAIKKGAKNFVLNAFWQLSLFKNPKQLNLWAGPYCNITNSTTLNTLKQYGFSGAIVSPELDKDTFLSLPQKSSLPLGVVIYGNWPLGISRIISSNLKTNLGFTSPKGEYSWISKQNNNYFIFPNWYLDLQSKKEMLKKAGFTLFVSIHENTPKNIKIKNRPGLWNWNLKLL